MRHNEVNLNFIRQRIVMPAQELRVARMSERLLITVNGRMVQVSAGCCVAAAIMTAGEPSRISIGGEPRAPLCGMGICMECRATVNGVPHQRTCQLLCAPGMDVVTG
jgi:hypothetical protein